MHFYATFNSRADLKNGNRGFFNTVEVIRFKSKEDRAAFVRKYENQMAEPVTRDEAARVFASVYYSEGDAPPVGGLFGRCVQWADFAEMPGQFAEVMAAA